MIPSSTCPGCGYRDSATVCQFCKISKIVQPAPDCIKAARKLAGQTQTEAGHLVHVKQRAWARWESGERAINLAAWELYQIKLAADIKREPNCLLAFLR